MSSLQREPLTGTILQGKKVVGGVALPEQGIQQFVEQFNHCYGPMGLKIDVPLCILSGDPEKPKKLIPVGAGHYNPFRTGKKP
jgi:hypothetical protein